MSERDPVHLLPLTSGMFQVLNALADGEKHAYPIIKEVARRTGGDVTLSAATLYTIVRRFVQEGVIAESAERPDPSLDDEPDELDDPEAACLQTLLAQIEEAILVREPGKDHLVLVDGGVRAVSEDQVPA